MCKILFDLIDLTGKRGDKIRFSQYILLWWKTNFKNEKMVIPAEFMIHLSDLPDKMIEGDLHYINTKGTILITCCISRNFMYGYNKADFYIPVLVICLDYAKVEPKAIVWNRNEFVITTRTKRTYEFSVNSKVSNI